MAVVVAQAAHRTETFNFEVSDWVMVAAAATTVAAWQH